MNQHPAPIRHVAVLGAGAWGTALASVASRQTHCMLWARDAELALSIQQTHENTRYLPGTALPTKLTVTDQLATALDHVLSSPVPGLLILGVPLAGLRTLCGEVAHLLGANYSQLAGLLWTCKGLEVDSGKLPHEIAQEALRSPGGQLDLATGVLSGPSFAKEVAQGLPVALTVASKQASLRQATIEVLHGGAMRVYASDDLMGVEVGGALKNVIAIACGISDGLGLGANARAALITRGLAEISRFGCALGGQAATFSGLTGLGDLVLTATGDLSRNRQVGLALGHGKNLTEILAGGLTAEGARCAMAVRLRAEALSLDMPITQAVCEVLFDGITPQHAVSRLLAREATVE